MMANLAAEQLFATIFQHPWLRMRASTSAAWAAVLVLAAIDLAWSYHSGLSFTFDWLRISCAFGLIGSLTLVYGIGGRSPRLGNMANYTGLWVAFTITGAIFTYLTARLERPLIDSQLAAFDASLSFDWITWFNFVAAHPALSFLLGAAYSSLLFQIVGSIMFFLIFTDPSEIWNCGG